MHVITLNGKPASIERLAKATKTTGLVLSEHEAKSLLAGTSPKAVQEHFVSYFGFTWKERAKGVELAPATLPTLVPVLKPAAKKAAAKAPVKKAKKAA